jgi:23S rRNA (uridine2552-2'-O)-methyltransferase
MANRSKSSQRWLSRQHQDPYVERALREGWRSRAAFKLQQIQTKEKLLSRGRVCLDLGACPGGWSQYAAPLVGDSGRIVALDLLPLEPIPGVLFVQGDFADAAVRERIAALLEGRSVDLVMSDIAPNSTGTRVVDQARAMEVAEQVLEYATEVLRPGGDTLIKVFQGTDFDALVASARALFGRVKTLKPPASRAESREIYLLARNYRMV